MIAALMSLIMLAAATDREAVDFTESGPDGCTMTIRVEPPSYRVYRDRWYPVVHGMTGTCLPGLPVLPAVTVYVPVPPDCDPEMEYDHSGRIQLDIPGPLLVTPVAVGSGLETEWEIPEAERGAALPEMVEVRTFQLAGTRVAAVTVHPFSGMDDGWIPSSIQVRLHWPRTGGSRSPDTPLLRVLCAGGLEYWPAGRTSDGPGPFWGRPWARMAISASGIYIVTGSQLEDAGVGIAGAPSRSLRVLTGPGLMFDLDDPAAEHQPVEVPVEVMDGGDGIFDESDSLKFFGRGLSRLDLEGEGATPRRTMHRYADHNVYWLTWGAEDGLRVDTVEALPDGSPQWGDSLRYDIWQEQDYLWVGGQDSLTGWVWTQLFEGIPSYFYFSTPSADGSGSVRFLMVPETGNNGPHEMTAELNGDVIGDTVWTTDDPREFLFDGLDLDPSMNLLKVTVDESPGKLYLDYMMADYSRRLDYAASRMLSFAGAVPGRYTLSLGGALSSSSLLDLSDPGNPVRIRGQLSGALLETSMDIDRSRCLWLEGEEGYRVPDSITSAEPGRIMGSVVEGEVAIVVADQLMEAAQPLETIYAGRGRTAAVVAAGEVYDEFGQGIRDPGAIRSFFRYTQDSWSQPAEALLLVGDGSYDPMMHVTSNPTLIPICLDLVSSAGTNIDDRYVIAHENGELPEVPVSRIPVSSAAELSGYLAKLMSYDGRQASGQWENRVILAADDEWGNYSVNEYDHTESCELLADTILPSRLDREKFYLIEFPWPPGTTPSGVHPEKPEARQAFIQELSEGCAGMIFFGHGSYGQLAHEKILVSSDVQVIDNGGRLPVMIFASCDLAHFDMSSAKCLAEDFLLIPGSGSVVSIGSTRESYSGQNEDLFAGYYYYQYGDDDLTVGESMWAAKVVYAPIQYYNSRLYVTLGDGGILPVGSSSEGCSFDVEGDSLYRGRMNTVYGEFTSGSSGFVRVTESGMQSSYSGLGSGSVDYLHYGSDVYQGLVSSDGTGFTVPFFMPVQADTGSYSRGSAVGLCSGGSQVAHREWIRVLDDGVHDQDSLPPEIEMWLEGHRGEDHPSVSGQTTIWGIISDPSGVCAMGAGAGRSVLLSLDSQGFDVSRYFQYRPDSYTTGELEYALPEMTEGEHRLILAAWDGMGNAGRDTLDFSVVQAPDELLSSVFAYPNPGAGQRCFSFEAAVSGTAGIKVYTVSGRCIWNETVICREGYNQVVWNGLDMDGDPPASGPYVYRVDLSTLNGSSASFTGILAVMNEE